MNSHLRMPDLRIGIFNRAHVPTYIQNEASECGLACIAMISTSYGHTVSVSELRASVSTSLNGSTLSELVEVANGIGLLGRAVRVEPQQLSMLKLPCVLHWDMNHFVVLVRAGKRSIVIHDPALGRRRVPMSSVSTSLTGVALELTVGRHFAPRRTAARSTIGQMTGQVQGAARAFVLLFLLGLALHVCVLTTPLFLQWLVDDVLNVQDVTLIHVMAVGFLVMVLLQSLATALRGWAATVLTADLNFQWLRRTFHHLLGLPMRYFHARHLGDVQSRFESVQAIQRTFTVQAIEGVLDGAMGILTLAAMCLYDIRLALISTSAILLYGLSVYLIFRHIQDHTFERIVHESRQHTNFLESVRGVETIKVFDGEAHRCQIWTECLARQTNSELAVARLTVLRNTLQVAILGAERIVIIWLGALLVIDAKLSLGMLLAYLGFREVFALRSSALVDNLFEIRMLALHVDRVRDIVDQSRQTVVSPGAVPERWDIEARNLAFSHDGERQPLFHNMSFSIRQGECVAIVGASGAGKTTLARLLLGLITPSGGAIFLGGVPFPQIDSKAFKAHVVAVMQSDVLFNGTIAENISFFASSPDQDLIEHCASIVNLTDCVARLPMRYRTLVGDLGGMLSGGEVQRIVLARALYRQPSVLILDEATSHLDTENENIVSQSVRALGITRILIAHRPETIASADRVLVLEHGRLSERL